MRTLLILTLVALLLLATGRTAHASRHRLHGKPGAAAPTTLFTGPATVGGQSGTLTLTFTPDALPPPPPPPPSPVVIGGVTNAAGGSIRSGNAGDAVRLSGQGFGTAAGTVTIANLSATVTSWSDTAIGLVLPAPPSGFAVGKIVVTLPGQPAVTGPYDFSVSAHSAPPPPPPPVPKPATGPGISGFVDAAGNLLASAKPGDTITIVGSGFGTMPGTVTWNGGATLPVLSWTDTMVTVRLEVAPPNAGWMTLQPAGSSSYFSSLAFPLAPR